MASNICMIRRQPEKLQNACLNVICPNFNEILSKAHDCKMERGIKSLQMKSEDLLRKFKEMESSVSVEHATFCLNSNLYELDLNWFKLCDVPSILTHLKTAESNLTVLWAPTTTDMTLSDLWQLVRSLPKTLKSLSLSQTGCTNSMLEFVTNQCPALQKIQLKNCRSINNSGILALCHRNNSGNVCPNSVLRELDLRDTNVTKQGIAFALECFVNAIEINHDYVSHVIYETYDLISADNLPNINPYNLKSLNVTRCPNQSADVLKAVNILCPHLTQLKVDNTCPKVIPACMQFTSLQDVWFVNFRCSELLPFLEARGKSLKVLTVTNWSNESSLSSLVKFCPNLERLTLYNPRFAKVESFTDDSLQDSLPYLKQLTISMPRQDNLEESLIFLISRCPVLEEFIYDGDDVFASSTFADSLIRCISTSTLQKMEMKQVDISVTELTDAFSNFSVELSTGQSFNVPSVVPVTSPDFVSYLPISRLYKEFMRMSE